MIKWFSRLADVPKLGYPGHPTIDRTQLKGHDVVAKREFYEHWEDGSRQETLMWQRGDEEGSGSPAFSHWMNFENRSQNREETAMQVLQRAFEALELPGTLNDYHHILEGICSDLWRFRKAEPRGIKFIDQFACLDLSLVEKYPKLYEHLDLEFGTALRSVEQLIEINLREGKLEEALSLAERSLAVTPQKPPSIYPDVHKRYAEKIVSIRERRDRVRLYGV